ncbi:MAG: DUF6445 family protein [Lentisphaerota bacterium]
MTVLILDNFLEMPTIVRKWAINQEYYTSKEFTEMHNKHTDWPGKRTSHVADLDIEYADIVLGKVANIAIQQYGLKNISIRSFFQLTTSDNLDSWVHQDNDTDVAAILYLNPNPPVNSGTTLYRCKNIQKWTSFMSDQQGYATLKTINALENKELYEELFEPVDIIGNVFNRLVIYKGTEYHKSNNYFGNSVEDGRLTQVFFVKGE